jgi:hypothetical protein
MPQPFMLYSFSASFVVQLGAVTMVVMARLLRAEGNGQL